jgi:hypothetical protein
MTDKDTQYNKTPEYTLRAIKAYVARNPELIKQRNHEKYLKLTPEQKENYKLQRKEQRDNMTQEQRDVRNAKRREYYQKRKLLKKVEVDIPIQTLTIE